MTNSNVLTSIVPSSVALASNPSEITGNPDVPVSDPTVGMSRQEARTWARTITDNLRVQTAEVMESQLTFQERLNAFTITLKEAYAGRVWEQLGYASRKDWLANEFTDERIRLSAENKHLTFVHLYANGFSIGKIAELFGMSKRGVSYNIKHAGPAGQNGNDLTPARDEANGDQEGSDFPPGHPGAVASAPRPVISVTGRPSSGQVDRRTTGLDGKSYSRQRSKAEMVADWLRFKGLMARGWSQRRISRETGIPYQTVNLTLEQGEPRKYELVTLFLKAKTMVLDKEHPASRADVCSALGLRMEAVDWLLDPANKPRDLIDILDMGSIEPWTRDHANKLRLYTGEEVTQSDLAAIWEVNQTRVSQIIGVRREPPAPTPAAGSPASPDCAAPAQSPLPSTASWDRPVGADWHYSTDPSTAAIEDMPATRLEERYAWRNTGILDYGCRQLLEDLDDHIMQVDPTNPDQADIYYDAACRVVVDALPHLLTAVNLLCTYHELISNDEIPGLRDLVVRAKAQLDRNADAVCADQRFHKPIRRPA